LEVQEAIRTRRAKLVALDLLTIWAK
jgi:hypothetical protein